MPESVRRARRGLAVYLALVALASGVFEALLLRTHDPIDRHPSLVLGLMWSPTLAALLARLALREGIADVSFRPGGARGVRLAALAWIFPVLVGLLAYGTAWATGLAQFAAPSGVIASLRGAPPAARFAARLALALTIGVPLSAITAAGEEFGWRGYMLTRLVDARVPRPVLVSGLVWGLWHTPLIVTGQYAAGPHPALSVVVFLVSILPAAYVHAYVRLASGSVWPAVVAHATWNVVIQSVFDASTRGGSATRSSSIWVGESGLLVVAASALVAALVLPRAWPVRRSPRESSPATLTRM